ncbi:MAG: hypothetical protein AAGD96_33195 [Chloroflexota bacterium]
MVSIQESLGLTKKQIKKSNHQFAKNLFAEWINPIATYNALRALQGEARRFLPRSLYRWRLDEKTSQKPNILTKIQPSAKL